MGLFDEMLFWKKFSVKCDFDKNVFGEIIIRLNVFRAKHIAAKCVFDEMFFCENFSAKYFFDKMFFCENYSAKNFRQKYFDET